MDGVSIIGVDLAKRSFQLHGADALGQFVFQKSCRGLRFCRFSPKCPTVSSPWKAARARFSGTVRLASLAMTLVGANALRYAVCETAEE